MTMRHEIKVITIKKSIEPLKIKTARTHLSNIWFVMAGFCINFNDFSKNKNKLYGYRVADKLHIKNMIKNFRFLQGS